MTAPLWTDDRDAEAVRLWNEDGLSGGQIALVLAEAYDIPVTRGAVLGRLKRLRAHGVHIIERSTPEERENRNEMQRRRAEERQAEARRLKEQRIAALDRPKEAQTANGPASEEDRPVVPAPIAAPPHVPGHPVEFFSVRNGQCRFVVSADGAWPVMFCGDPTAPSKAWCSHHREICYQPIIPKRLRVSAA
jgi:GcrA cell cycle regulator